MNRKKCAFTDCSNPVMRGPLTGHTLSCCQECFDRGRPWAPPKETVKKCPEAWGRMTVLRRSLREVNGEKCLTLAFTNGTVITCWGKYAEHYKHLKVGSVVTFHGYVSCS